MSDSSAVARANLIVKVLGILSLLVGLAAGAMTLGAVAGVWAGAWDFGRGFQLLFADGTGTTQWTQYVALACVVDGIGLVILGKALGATNGARMAVVALVGAGVAFVAWYIPSSHRPAPDANIPPIHDISTDTSNPPQFVAVLPLRADAANTAEYGMSEGMTPDELRRLTADAYGDLKPVTLPVPPAEAFGRALAAARSLGWEIVAEVPNEGRIEATDTTFWFRFKDDIVIRIRPATGGSVVDARSVSRVGRSDVGTNARRLRSFFERL